jgi:hypothetical protein
MFWVTEGGGVEGVRAPGTRGGNKLRGVVGSQANGVGASHAIGTPQGILRPQTTEKPRPFDEKVSGPKAPHFPNG